VGTDEERHSDFGRLLRRRRVEAGLTQEELATRAELSVRTIRDLERGTTTRPYRHSVDRLADALRLAGDGRQEFSRAARRSPGGTGIPGPSGPAGPPGPRQLPAAAPDFTGRFAELTALTELLEWDSGGPGTVVVAAAGGIAGVGKTTLGVTWAHQLAGRFPDGQLYADLRGYGAGPPVRPAAVLAAFLTAFGLARPDIPPGAEERAARYRSLLAGRRMLVFLDNAGSAEQIRPLLPGSAACAVVVTSRDALAGLVARDGARRLDLDLFSPADADMLLATLIGDRATASPDATADLAAGCTRLPLAVRVAAGVAALRPGAPVAELAAELAAERQRQGLAATGGPAPAALRAVFTWSHRQLDPAVAHVLRLVSLPPGPGLDLPAAAALLDLPPAAVEQPLGLLARAGLLRVTAPGWYVLHDALRALVRELAAGAPAADRRVALTRLRDHHAGLGAAAADEITAELDALDDG